MWVFVAFSDLIRWDEVTMKEGKSTVAWRPLLLRVCLVSFGRCSCKTRVPVPEWWTLGSFTSLFFLKWKLNSGTQTFSRSLELHAAFFFIADHSETHRRDRLVLLMADVDVSDRFVWKSRAADIKPEGSRQHFGDISHFSHIQRLHFICFCVVLTVNS